MDHPDSNTPSPPQSTDQPLEQKNHTGRFILLGLIALVASLGFWMYKSQYTPVSSNPKSDTMQPSATQGAQTWQAYTNSSYGFSFEQPNIPVACEEPQNAEACRQYFYLVNDRVVVVLENFTSSTSTMPSVSVYASDDTHASLDAYINSRRQALVDFYQYEERQKGNNNSPQTLIDVFAEPMSTGGYDGAKLFVENIPMAYIVQNPSDGRIYSIRIPTDTSKPLYAETTQRVLTSWKFLDTALYVDPKGQFQFEYPKQMHISTVNGRLELITTTDTRVADPKRIIFEVSRKANIPIYDFVGVVKVSRGVNDIKEFTQGDISAVSWTEKTSPDFPREKHYYFSRDSVSLSLHNYGEDDTILDRVAASVKILNP